MTLSKDKIVRMMDFFVKESGLGLSIVSGYPKLLLLSLEKTIIPRYSVIIVLMSRELLNGDVNFYTICHLKEEKFLEKYVIKYQLEILRCNLFNNFPLLTYWSKKDLAKNKLMD
ncbi:hypothetical protein QJS10_CPA05g00647 [Acorus calamus]|uniref:Uncharacterized protein n=1 Tax=Acorus calamus TaxID=4465 RepID=A0AAV9EUJ6_ACOCL|nr:hypothetical protein QJS10_CPA05g00647 [Acorus calamus]